MPYYFTTTKTGFEITHSSHPHASIQVEQSTTGLVIHTPQTGSSLAFGLFEYYEFARWLAKELSFIRLPGDVPVRKHEWMQTKIARWIGKELHRHWKQLLTQSDPMVVAIQRRVFASTFSTPSLLLSPALYRDPWLVRDLQRYDAAACAAFLIDREHEMDRGYTYTDYKPHSMDEEDIVAYMKQRAAEFAGESEQLDRLRHWRDLFSATGKAYTSLNKTLDRVSRIPARLLLELRAIHLERPILSRVELLFLLTQASVEYGQRKGRHRHVYIHAQEADIREALRRVAAHTRNPFKAHRRRDLILFAHFLDDYPDIHRGTIVGLADKSIDWHRHAQERVRQEQLASLGGEHTTALPPIPLPEEPGVRFLATVGEVLEEGASMGHCIGSYARMAVAGQCYLFHIDHNNEQASVEVTAMGQVRQSFGPHNQLNAAAAWGGDLLNNWGRNIAAAMKQHAIG